MIIGLDTYKHLLPRGRAWRLTIDRFLRQYFVGLSDLPADVQDYQDGVWRDYRPADTTKLDEWDEQFGFLPTAATEQDRRDRLDAAWKSLGGQSPRYLQDAVQAAGFPLFIHDWWIPSILPTLIARDPRAWITVDGSGFVFRTQLGKPTAQLGGPLATLGRSAPAGRLLGDNLVQPVTLPSDPATWPFFIYWGGATFGDFVSIPVERETELITLLLKLCPAQLWVGIFVEFT